MYDSICIIKESWDEVKKETITNCFNKPFKNSEIYDEISLKDNKIDVNNNECEDIPTVVGNEKDDEYYIKLENLSE